jgi:hypothetical protein
MLAINKLFIFYSRDLEVKRINDEILIAVQN